MDASKPQGVEQLSRPHGARIVGSEPTSLRPEGLWRVGGGAAAPLPQGRPDNEHQAGGRLTARTFFTVLLKLNFRACSVGVSCFSGFSCLSFLSLVDCSDMVGCPSHTQVVQPAFFDRDKAGGVMPRHSPPQDQQPVHRLRLPLLSTQDALHASQDAVPSQRRPRDDRVGPRSSPQIAEWSDSFSGCKASFSNQRSGNGRKPLSRFGLLERIGQARFVFYYYSNYFENVKFWSRLTIRLCFQDGCAAVQRPRDGPARRVVRLELRVKHPVLLPGE